MNLNKELYEFKEIDEKVKNKLNYIKANPEIMSNNINEVKALKNDIYEKTSKVFIYNLISKNTKILLIDINVTL